MASGVAVLEIRGSSEEEVNKKYIVSNRLNATRALLPCLPVLDGLVAKV